VSESRAKYGNRRVEADGYVFDSLREMRRYRELSLLLAAGEIADLEIHPVFELVAGVVLDGRRKPALRYAADFSYLDRATDLRVVEDVKGVRTDVYRIKRHLMKAMLGIEVREVG
jgi:hypothetical protein